MTKAVIGRLSTIPSVPMKVRHQTPGNLDLGARKDYLAHAHASKADGLVFVS